MEHKIIFRPADDKTDPDPYKNYGVHDIDMKFLVFGDKGIVEFELSTNWYLPHVMERRLQSMKRNVFLAKKDFLLMTWISPKPLDICYWSLERLSEDDTFFDKGLDYVFDHKPCFYGYRYEREEDGLWTTDYVYNQFLLRGDIAIWEYLENYYRETFGEE